MKDTQEKSKKLSLKSMSITADQKKKLKQIFPEVFNEDKIDWERLKTTLGEELDKGSERYHINWPGKRDCFRFIQEPSFATLKPCKEESLDFDKTQNLFIEGDNLEVLKLLQKAYYNKVKMIYIDPPYNTGKDFIYPDKYSETLETYLQYTGQKSAKGKSFSTNQETDGRFHSKWINMLYPRLFLARNLLKEDGVIFISIDDHEVTNLRKICDEIFGEENFITCCIWNSTKSVTNTAIVSVSHTYKLVYAKEIDFFKNNRFTFRLPEDKKGFSNPDNDPRGPWKADPFQVGGWRPNQQYEIKNPKTGKIYKPNVGCSWKNDYNNFKNLIEDNRIIFGVSGETGPQRKRFLFEAVKRGKVSKTLWDDIGTTTTGTFEIKELFNKCNIFSNPKPVNLLKKIIQLGDHTKEGIILDFFAGSGTTAHAVMNLNKEDGGNRKYICVQLPEPVPENTEAYKVGYKTIADIGKERIRRAVKKIKEETTQQNLLEENKNNLDLGFRVFKLDKSNFKIWEEQDLKNKQATEQTELQLEAFINPKSSEEDLLYEILIKAGYKLTTPVKSLKIADKKVYSVENKAFLICLENSFTKDLIIEMAKLRPVRIVCLDLAFENKDQLKTNAVQLFRSFGVIDFETV